MAFEAVVSPLIRIDTTGYVFFQEAKQIIHVNNLSPLFLLSVHASAGKVFKKLHHDS